ncbi:MAG: NAD-dependent epimerase/dehydratase family protein [Candidatus Marsarchaeota archaeon]|nr:NAD-dependent epimerase/dehydratase family protein [Candidatus Marsarchaeota archaeon]
MILVTGASGHLGTHLVKRLVSDEEQVRVIVNKHPFNMSGVEIVHRDITDGDFARQALDGIETVYHLAAMVDGYGVMPKDMVYKVNVLGTKNLIENFNGNRFIYMSTTSVYGYDMKENPAKPTTQYNPLSYYAKTKVEAEKIVLAHNGIVMRAPVILGPGFNKSFDDLLNRLAKGKMIVIGNGNNHIQWIHVNDLMDALILAKEKGISGNVYLVAGKDVTTQAGLYEKLASAMGAESPKKHVSLTTVKMAASFGSLKSKLTGKQPKLRMEYVNRLVSDRRFDISKAETDLGFNPKVTYEKWAQELVSSYKDQKQ